MLLLLEAMARQEGFLDPTSRPHKNNNPGDIEWGKFAQSHGAIRGDPRFAVFPDATTGYKCMAALLHSAYHGLTIKQAVYKWLGYSMEDAAADVKTPDEKGNYPATYVEHVCEWTGLPDHEIIDSHLELP